MLLREALEPQIDIARKQYAIIKNRILAYTVYCDENGDEDSSKYKELEDDLHRLTGKEMSKYNLWEWWEGDGIENLSFKIALPEPPQITDFTKEELTEVLKRIKTFEAPTKYEGDEILMLLWTNKTDYYHELLKLNFDNYDFKYFIRNKDNNGNYFEYSIDDIVEQLWNK